MEENDILEAEKQYSQYALESILVENGGASGLLESTIYEFVGCRARLSRYEVESYLTKGGVGEDKNVAINRLCTLTFLGVEVGPGDFRFAEDPEEYRKNLVLARKCSERLGGQIRYMVNRPFWAFLEITDGD